MLLLMIRMDEVKVDTPDEAKIGAVDEVLNKHC
jgi:hypothetical protein